jgi:RNA-directed DNA polymerase
VSQVRLIRLLNPVLRGWGNYFSKAVSQDIFGRLDALIFAKLRAWAYHRHQNKGRRWIVAKYWSYRPGRWVFGIAGQISLVSLSGIPIKRHVGLQVARSPFDGDWVYWSQRLGQYPDTPKSVAIRLRLQQGRCSCCGLNFCPEDEMKLLHLDGDRKNFTRGNLALVHERCVTCIKKRVKSHQIAEEPYEGKLSRTVLKTSTGREARA